MNEYEQLKHLYNYIKKNYQHSPKGKHLKREIKELQRYLYKLTNWIWRKFCWWNFYQQFEKVVFRNKSDYKSKIRQIKNQKPVGNNLNQYGGEDDNFIIDVWWGVQVFVKKCQHDQVSSSYHPANRENEGEGLLLWNILWVAVAFSRTIYTRVDCIQTLKGWMSRCIEE